MNHVRCASCRRTLAFTPATEALRNKVYCSSWCMDEPPATQYEARNDQWKALNEHGLTPVAISKIYGVPHSQVYKAIARL